MIFDGVLLQKVLIEFKCQEETLLRQIYQSGKANFYFKFGHKVLQISLRPDITFVAVRENIVSEDTKITPFVRFLRDKLRASKLTNIKQFDLDRVFLLEFTQRNAFGETVAFNLITEIMGPNSNMFVTDNNMKIINALNQRVTRNRTLIPGADYKPPVSSGINPEKFTYSEFIKIISSSENPARDLSKKLQGFSPKRFQRFFGYHGKSIDLNNPIFLKRFWASFQTMVKGLNEPYVYYISTENEDYIDIFPAQEDQTEKIGFSEAILKFAEAKRRKREFDDILNRYKSLIQKAYKKLDRLLDKLENEYESVKDYEDYKKLGELLTSNLYRLTRKTEQVEVFDWYNNENRKINLDPTKTPAENAQLFFKYYEKARRKSKHLRKRIGHINRQLEYFNDLLETVNLCESKDELDFIKDELEKIGLLKTKKKRESKNEQVSGPKVYEKNGFRYLVGRNNIQNDEITRNAAKDDIWFHARNIPGAHVILKRAGKKPSKAALDYGAYLAASNSRGRYDNKVEVDYTLVKYVRKPKGLPPGKVLYDSFKTIAVNLSDYEQEKQEE
ncbi:MAG: fibronectin-binding domain-containing protein [Kosmotoga sp.]|nr:MAG: fibronectin-binding domain-containing protein [Kosmotoga sp.]